MRTLMTNRNAATEEGFASLQFGKIPKSWGASPRSMFVRLPCVQLTGRRVIPDGR
jgi:hypothetical protein